MTAMRALASLLALTAASFAHADIYKCIDGNGRITYTNDQSLARGCKTLDSDLPVSSVPPPRAPAAKSQPTPTDFPRVTANDQRARDDTRRQVLEKELADEEQALTAAKAALGEQEAARGSDPSAGLKVQPFKDKIELHQRNIEALKREIANLK